MSDVAESARVRLLFADYASIDAAGKINIIGAGITIMGLNADGGVTAPHAVIALVTFAPEFVGESPAVELALEHDDGSLVTLPGAAGPLGEPQFLRVGSADILKPPPAIPGAKSVPHEAIRPSVQFVMHFANGLPLPPGHVYRWRVRVDHDTRDDWTESFFVPAADPGPVIG